MRQLGKLSPAAKFAANCLCPGAPPSGLCRLANVGDWPAITRNDGSSVPVGGTFPPQLGAEDEA